MGFGKVVLGMVLIGGAAVAATAIVGDDEVTATVKRVIDGDTVVVDKDGVETDVRLLNVDTPEIGRNGEASECLAEDAKEYLEELLPAGTEVTLEYDEVTIDRYDRELAGVFKDGLFINEAIAAKGLADAKSYQGNERFYPQVKAAADEAKSKKLGIFDVPADCLIREPEAKQDFQSAQQAAQVDGAGAAAGTVATVVVAQQFLDDLPGIRSALKAAVAARFLSDFYKSRQPERLDDEVERIEEGLDDKEREFRQIVDDHEVDRDADTPKPEDQHMPGEGPDRDGLNGNVESPSNGHASDPAPRPEPDPVPAPAPSPAPAPAPAPSAGGGGGDGYTGCRAYGGNYAMTNIDDKGRAYAKIDCVTRAQIG